MCVWFIRVIDSQRIDGALEAAAVDEEPALNRIYLEYCHQVGRSGRYL